MLRGLPVSIVVPVQALLAEDSIAKDASWHQLAESLAERDGAARALEADLAAARRQLAESQRAHEDAERAAEGQMRDNARQLDEAAKAAAEQRELLRAEIREKEEVRYEKKTKIGNLTKNIDQNRHFHT